MTHRRTLAALAGVGALGLALGACTRTPRAASSGPDDGPLHDKAPMTTTDLAPTVRADVLTATARRPPLTQLAIELTLTNPTAAPAWFLVPRDLANPIGRGGVDVLEVSRWSAGADAVTIGSFQGTGGFSAISVGAHATVVVRGLPVQWFRDDDQAGPPPLRVVVAAGVTIGDRPIAAWFPQGDPVITDAATVAAGEVVASVRFEPTSAEVPVSLAAPATHQLELSLP